MRPHKNKYKNTEVIMIARTVICPDEDVANSLWTYLTEGAIRRRRDVSRIIRGPPTHDAQAGDYDVLNVKAAISDPAWHRMVRCWPQLFPYRWVRVQVQDKDAANPLSWSGVIPDIYGTENADAGRGGHTGGMDHIVVQRFVVEEEEDDMHIFTEAENGRGHGGQRLDYARTFFR